MFKKLDFMSFGAWLTNGWYYVRFYFLAYLTCYFKHPPKNEIHKKGFDLVFNDEFDIPPINWDIWSPCEHWGCIRVPVDPKLIYKAEQVWIENGCAVMKTELNNSTESVYTEYENNQTEPRVKSGELTTHKTLNQLYGYFETREKLPPDGVNNWASFWAYPSNAWPPEIDVFELMGKNSSYITMTLHYADWTTNKKEITELIAKIDVKYGWKATDPQEVLALLREDWTQEKQIYAVKLLALEKHDFRPRELKFPKKDFLARDFHTYGCLWTEKKVVWYIDNKAVYVLDKHIPTQPMYWLITNGVNGKYTTPPATLPSVVLCDYFRAYEEL
ncbi:MAG: family 16 glycosylhydrolase [Bacteroidales bacterium]|jgi:beta-glucanase (GH16 family)